MARWSLSSASPRKRLASAFAALADPRHRARTGASAAVGVVVVLVASTLLLNAPRPPATGAASPTPGGTGASPSPSATDGAWARLQLPDLPLAADLAPLASDATGVRPESGFGLVSLAAEPAQVLATRLVASPSVAWTVSATDDRQAVIRPTSPLAAGQAYRFVLRGPAGDVQGSWLFTVRGPLRVLSTLPAARTTAYPVDRAIEFTFDQDGAADIQPYFSIRPAVSGRFERHGRTQVFVPDHLAPQTLYTATLKAGLPRTGTDLKLGVDVVLSFETAGSTPPSRALLFGRDAVEWPTSSAPVLAFAIDAIEGSRPTTAEIAVYRYPDEAAAANAYRDFLASPRWVEYSRPTLATAGLPLVATFTARLEADSESYRGTVRFPEPLPAGWYAVKLAGSPPAYAFLQITNAAAWSAVLRDRTVVWVNDAATGAPMVGATVSLVGGTTLASTDARGLAITSTVASLADADRSPIVSVHGRDGSAVLIAFDVPFRYGAYDPPSWEPAGASDAEYWSLLETDRGLYRRGDRIAAWGYVRGRDGGGVPERVVLELRPTGASAESVLLRAEATPTASGAFLETLAYDRLPYGDYLLSARVGERSVATTWLQVDAIRKPAYQLDVTADRSAIIDGTPVTFVTKATFFDGSPVPGLTLRVREGEAEREVATSTDGTITTTAHPASYPGTWAGGSSWSFTAYPLGPEAGSIQGSSDVLVFPSSDYTSGEATVAGTTLRVSGSVHAVDIARVDRERAGGGQNVDPAGPAIAGRTVSIAVTRLHSARTQTGTYYDFVEKVVRPLYTYSTEKTPVSAGPATTGADGTFTSSIQIPDGHDQYEVQLTSQDAQGRRARATVFAGSSNEPQPQYVASLQTPDGKTLWDHRYAIGQRVALTLVEEGLSSSTATPARYLYLVAQRGVVDVTVGTSPAYERVFRASDVPGLYVMAIPFRSGAYGPGTSGWARFEPSTRSLKVSIQPDRERYRPGEDAVLTIRTTDLAGTAKAADVVVQAVDEKLFAIGGASAPDTLARLYDSVDTGIVRVGSTHVAAASRYGGGYGDTTGGGGRSDFRDLAFSGIVTTGSDGTARLSVHLPDDLTSWHVVAAAFTSTPETGVGERLVPVGLPLFVDATIADEYLAGDRPSIRLRAFGTALSTGDAVTFTVAAPSLGLNAATVAGTAFRDTLVALPALTVGRHQLDVTVTAKGRTGADGKPLSDRLIRSMDVVTSRVTVAASWYGTVSDALPTVDSADPATYVLADGGSGRYLPALLDAAGTPGLRLDRRIAYDLATKALVARFGMVAAGYEPVDLAAYVLTSAPPETGVPGVNLVPGGSPDPWLAARVAALAPGALRADEVRSVLQAILALPETRRDLRIAAVAGLAGLGDPVSSDLRDLAAASDLSATERIDLALGFLRVGDDASARSIERSLLTAYGQELGPWVRVRTGESGSDVVDVTARLAVVAAGLGDPLASGMVDFVRSKPSTQTSNTLELVAAAVAALDRTPAVPARVAYTIDGSRTEASIAAEDTVSLTLTSAQRRTFRLERLSGSVGVVVSWRRTLASASPTLDPSLTLTRTAPGEVTTSQLVTVDLEPRFLSGALEAGCYEVVEQAPSGLVPVPGATSSSPSILWPSSVVGQEVRWCVGRGDTAQTLRYTARVVNAGTFVWEPATLQHSTAMSAIAISPSSTLRISAP